MVTYRVKTNWIFTKRGIVFEYKDVPKTSSRSTWGQRGIGIQLNTCVCNNLKSASVSNFPDLDKALIY